MEGGKVNATCANNLSHSQLASWESGVYGGDSFEKAFWSKKILVVEADRNCNGTAVALVLIVMCVSEGKGMEVNV